MGGALWSWGPPATGKMAWKKPLRAPGGLERAPGLDYKF